MLQGKGIAWAKVWEQEIAGTGRAPVQFGCNRA